MSCWNVLDGLQTQIDRTTTTTTVDYYFRWLFANATSSEFWIFWFEVSVYYFYYSILFCSYIYILYVIL